MNQVYVAGCCRSAIGSFGGSLKDVPATKLGAIVVQEALKRAGVAPDTVDEVLLGCVLSSGLGQNVARQAAMAAGIPNRVPATTLNMVCGSGMKAVVEGARSILAGDADVVVVGGMENMSASPYVVPAMRWGARMSDSSMIDTMIRDGLWDAFNDYHMGITAENVGDQWNITREEMDAFSASSQQRAAAAQQAGRFADEIVPIPVRVKKETVDFQADEYIRSTTTAEALAKLKPAFRSENGKVTAGNSSGLNDGAAILVLVSEHAVQQYGLKPMARLSGWGQAGVDPSIMGIGPVTATKKALEHSKIAIEDIDLVEANEAFAAQALAVVRDLGLDTDNVNVNGGAIALGHPIGASGARIIVTLLHEMAKRPDAKKGLATLCIGGGMGIATIYEKCE